MMAKRRISRLMATRHQLLAVGLAFALGTTSAWSADESQGTRSCELGSNSIFTPHQWPEQNLDLFAQGKIGVLQPQYDHFYLYIAYRSLIGKPLKQSDVENLRLFDPCWDDGTRGYFGYDWKSAPKMIAARQLWDTARKAVTDSAVLPRPANPSQRSALQYLENYVPNCNPDAFNRAALTLRQRLSTYSGSQWVKQWVEGQDLVFGQCDAKSNLFPEPAPQLAPNWFQKDRSYQIAAAKFYAGAYQESVTLFDAISKDKNSPWSSISPYLSARALLRQATLEVAGSSPAQTQLFEDAQSRLIALKQQSADPSITKDAERLLQRIGLTLDPYGERRKIEERLNADILSEGLGQDVRDFNTSLLYESEHLTTPPGFGVWLSAMRYKMEVLPSQFIPPKDDAWLIARLQYATATDTDILQLLEEARAVRNTAAAYPTVKYHMLRLSSNHAAAMALVRGLLTDKSLALTQQDKNRIADLALGHVQSKTEFAQLVYIRPIQNPMTNQSGSKREDSMPAVDHTGAKILNEQLPIDVLYKIQQASKSPTPLRKALLGVVWTRALVLKRWDLIKRLEPDLVATVPQAKSEIQRIGSGQDTVSKSRMGAVFLAKYPGLLGNISTQIYGTAAKDTSELALPNMHRRHLVDWDRDNWWCSIPAGRYYSNAPMPAPPSAHPMLSDAEAKQWLRERSVLLGIPNATDFLGNAVLEWAASHPQDEYLPNALRMIVRSARGGCVNATTQYVGARAFRHLHRHFPQSEAAKSTRTHG